MVERARTLFSPQRFNARLRTAAHRGRLVRRPTQTPLPIQTRSGAPRGNPGRHGIRLTHACVVDISDAFSHIPLNPHFAQYTGFGVTSPDGGSKFYQQQCLPFGLRSSPVVWQQFIDVVIDKLRREHHMVVANHVDDIILLSSSADAAKQQLRLLLQELYNAGITPNLTKSTLTPTTQVEYLGFTLTLLPDRALVGAPKSKQGAVRRDLLRLARAKNPSPRRIAAVLGSVRALRPAWRTVLLDSFQLSRCLSHALKQTGGKGWDRPTTPHPTLHHALHSLAHSLLTPLSQPLSLPPQTAVYTVSTDASDHQWGAVLHRYHSPQQTEPHQCTPQCHRSHTSQHFSTNGYFHSSRQHLHITAKEALAALYGLQSFQHLLQPGSRIHLQVDSQSLYHALRRLRTKSPTLLPIVTQLAALTSVHSWTLTPSWVRSEDNPADEPSRSARDFDDYQVAPQVLQRALHQLHLPLPSIDLMTTAAHTQCPRFVSRLPQPTATATDLFSFPLHTLPDSLLYVNPPWGCIQRLLLHLTSLRPDQRVLLVTPTWERQPWYQHLQHLRRQHTQTPPRKGVFLDPLGLEMPTPRWSTDFSVICGADMHSQASRRRSCSAWSTHTRRGRSTATPTHGPGIAASATTTA